MAIASSATSSARPLVKLSIAHLEGALSIYSLGEPLLTACFEYKKTTNQISGQHLSKSLFIDFIKTTLIFYNAHVINP
jgi:hypothetical protein